MLIFFVFSPEKIISLQNQTTTSCNKGGSYYCKKKKPRKTQQNQDTSPQYITAYWNIPCISFTICLPFLILGCAALLNYMFKANQSKKEERGDWKRTGKGELFLLQNHPQNRGASLPSQPKPTRISVSIRFGRAKNPSAVACVFHF